MTVRTSPAMCLLPPSQGGAPGWETRRYTYVLCEYYVYPLFLQ